MDFTLQKILDLTWRNPVFMIVFIGAIWFIPGILLRSFLEKKYKESKEADQASKIARLYPKQLDEWKYFSLFA